MWYIVISIILICSQITVCVWCFNWSKRRSNYMKICRFVISVRRPISDRAWNSFILHRRWLEIVILYSSSMDMWAGQCTHMPRLKRTISTANLIQSNGSKQSNYSFIDGKLSSINSTFQLFIGRICCLTK